MILLFKILFIYLPMFQDELQFDIAVCVLSWQMLFYLQIIFVACVASKLNKDVV